MDFIPSIEDNKPRNLNLLLRNLFFDKKKKKIALIRYLNNLLKCLKKENKKP